MKFDGPSDLLSVNRNLASLWGIQLQITPSPRLAQQANLYAVTHSSVRPLSIVTAVSDSCDYLLPIGDKFLALHLRDVVPDELVKHL